MQLRSLVLASAFLSCPFAADSAAQLQATPVVVGGLTAPVGVVSPPGDTARLFVLERAGRIRIVTGGSVLTTPFLDLTGVVTATGEGGLLGLAFHPDYALNGRFFVCYTLLVSHAPNPTTNDPVVQEYVVSANPNVANPVPVANVFGPWPHSGNSHFAGCLQFGLDRKLHYTLGDGAGSGAALSLANYDGKMLRLDVDAGAPYVPADNPHYPVLPAMPTGLPPELTWAYGLRNPFRFSFDRLTGDLYMGDVGRNEVEEIDYQPASTGVGTPGYGADLNYGWDCMEGTYCASTMPTPPCPCATGLTLVAPVHEYYSPSAPAAVIGGYVYRGSAIPGIQGRYFFADFITGQVWSLAVSGGVASTPVDHTIEIQGTGPTQIVPNISSFGEDANGELYLTSISGGSLYRIDPVVSTACTTPPFSYCVTTPNGVGSGAIIGSTGSASIGAAELVLTVRHCPPIAAGLFFLGTAQTFVPFGNGVLCVAGTVVRMPVVLTDFLGNANQAFDYVGFPVGAGSTRMMQFYYRDSSGLTPFNLSDALQVTFCL